MNTTTMQISAGVSNPFDGVSPNIDVFGAELNTIAVTILGGIWGIVLLWTAGQALIGLAKWSSATRNNAAPEIVDESAKHFKAALVTFGLAVAIPLILGAIIILIARANG